MGRSRDEWVVLWQPLPCCQFIKQPQFEGHSLQRSVVMLQNAGIPHLPSRSLSILFSSFPIPCYSFPLPLSFPIYFSFFITQLLYILLPLFFSSPFLFPSHSSISLFLTSIPLSHFLPLRPPPPSPLTLRFPLRLFLPLPLFPFSHIPFRVPLPSLFLPLLLLLIPLPLFPSLSSSLSVTGCEQCKLWPLFQCAHNSTVRTLHVSPFPNPNWHGRHRRPCSAAWINFLHLRPREE